MKYSLSEIEQVVKVVQHMYHHIWKQRKKCILSVGIIWLRYLYLWEFLNTILVQSAISLSVKHFLGASHITRPLITNEE